MGIASRFIRLFCPTLFNGFDKSTGETAEGIRGGKTMLDFNIGGQLLLWALILCGLKAVIGFKFSWEPSRKAWDRLHAKIDELTIDQSYKNSMKDDLSWL